MAKGLSNKRNLDVSNSCTILYTTLAIIHCHALSSMIVLYICIVLYRIVSVMFLKIYDFLTEPPKEGDNKEEEQKPPEEEPMQLGKPM